MHFEIVGLISVLGFVCIGKKSFERNEAMGFWSRRLKVGQFTLEGFNLQTKTADCSARGLSSKDRKEAYSVLVSRRPSSESSSNSSPNEISPGVSNPNALLFNPSPFGGITPVNSISLSFSWLSCNSS